MTCSFATAINCMDGRVQMPVIQWMTGRFGVDCVDMVTEAGANGILATRREPCFSNIKERVEISINGHGSKVVAVVGHHDCAGNPGPKDMQIEHVKKGIDVLESWGIDARLLGLYVNEDWKVEVVHDSDD